MPGVGKHVDHPGRIEHEAVLVHQNPQVARQSSGMAGYIQHPARPHRGHCGEQRARPDARRIQQHMAVVPAQPRGGRPRRVGQIRGVELRIGDAVLDLYCGLGNFTLALLRAS